MPDLDDLALVERCLAGDVTAFESLVEKYRGRVYRLAFNVLRDAEDARDVAQEAFLRAWQALPSFRRQSAFYTWLFRIAMNVASDRARQRMARGRAFGTERVEEEQWERELIDPEEPPDARAARVEARRRIMRALDALPEHHRAIIMLSDLEGLSYREIAEVLRIPMGTVISRLHNARKRLRAALGPLLGVVLGLLMLLAPTPAPAQQVVRFGTRVVLASDSPPPPGMRLAPPGPDERLDNFLPKLRRTLPYKDYTSLERYRAEVSIGTTQRWPVPGDRVLEVTPEAVTKDSVKFQVRLSRGNVTELNTHFQAQHGNPVVLGGPRHGNGVLIFIVWPNP